MAGHSSNLEELKAIRLVLQRLCLAGGVVHLKHNAFEQDVPVFAELEDRLILGISDVVRGQWGFKPGMHLLMTLEDRGKKFEAVIEMLGHGRFEGVESCAFNHPRVLKCLNDDRLSDFRPDRTAPCTYSTHALEIRDGKIRAFGYQGVELCYAGADSKSGILRLGDETVLGLVLGKGESLVAPAKVVYFGDGYAGIHFREDADQAFLLVYRRWLEEMVRGQAKRDQDGFEPSGSRVKAHIPDTETRRAIKLLVDHDPLLLIISEGDAFPNRMAESLGRKYGLACLDYVQGRVHPDLAVLGTDGGNWGRVKLLLVHQRLRVSSGLELTRDLIQEERCPLPILVVGLEEDVPLKRNRAIAAGAVDFISVEPFHVLRVMKAIADTLQMFG
jgi:CheY-like chemotaxis protein